MQWKATDIRVTPPPFLTHTPKLDPVFVVLGYLDEYWGGRLVTNSDAVERFYPGKRAAADGFEGWLGKMADNRSICSAIEKRVDDAGFVQFVSRDMASFINAFYRAARPTSSPGDKSRQSKALPREVFGAAPRSRSHHEELDRRFSYILGAYERYGVGTAVRLANAGSKAELLRDILVEIGCEDVCWRMEAQGAPVLNSIEFVPTVPLRSLLKID